MVITAADERFKRKNMEEILKNTTRVIQDFADITYIRILEGKDKIELTWKNLSSNNNIQPQRSP